MQETEKIEEKACRKGHQLCKEKPKHPDRAIFCTQV